jgi:hypothetical protein
MREGAAGVCPCARMTAGFPTCASAGAAMNAAIAAIAIDLCIGSFSSAHQPTGMAVFGQRAARRFCVAMRAGLSGCMKMPAASR